MSFLDTQFQFLFGKIATIPAIITASHFFFSQRMNSRA
jgi:hypothetical protein